jgi:hypothetical protein
MKGKTDHKPVSKKKLALKKRAATRRKVATKPKTVAKRSGGGKASKRPFTHRRQQ